MDNRNINPAMWNFGDWKKFFRVAAAWNILGSVPAIIAPGLNLRIFYALKTDDYMMLFLNRSFWIAVLIFGIGYFIISLDPARHVGITVMGVIGKIIVALNWFYLFAIDKATFMVVFGGLGDSAFTVLFIYYLAAGPRSYDDKPRVAP
jgi:hypothetical protein